MLIPLSICQGGCWSTRGCNTRHFFLFYAESFPLPIARQIRRRGKRASKSWTMPGRWRRRRQQRPCARARVGVNGLTHKSIRRQPEGMREGRREDPHAKRTHTCVEMGRRVGESFERRGGFCRRERPLFEQGRDYYTIHYQPCRRRYPRQQHPLVVVMVVVVVVVVVVVCKRRTCVRPRDFSARRTAAAAALAAAVCVYNI